MTINASNLIKIVLAILFCLALLKLPYGYYEFIRFVGMVGFILLAYAEKDKPNKTWQIIWIVSAVMINPFFKLALGRQLWNVMDVCWAVLLIGTLSYFRAGKRVS